MVSDTSSHGTQGYGWQKSMTGSELERDVTHCHGRGWGKEEGERKGEGRKPCQQDTGAVTEGSSDQEAQARIRRELQHWRQSLTQEPA